MSKKSAGVSLIIVHYGDPGLLWNLLASLEQHPDKKLIDEVIIVNNGLSLDKGERVRLETYKNLPVKIADNPQNSYASGVNHGVATSHGDILVISNNDVEWLSNSSIQVLLDYLRREPHIGVVGPQLVYPNGTWQRSYGRFPSIWEAFTNLTMLDSLWHGIIMWAFRHNWLPRRPKRVNYIDGAFMVVRRSCFEELGGFNEECSFYGEDADFCWRAWKNGWKVVFVPDARVMHVRGASSTADALGDYTIRLIEAKLKFVQEHFGIHQAKWYRRLVQMALFERFILYNFVAKSIHSPNWQQRAFQACVRYHAIKRYNGCKSCYG